MRNLELMTASEIVEELRSVEEPTKNLVVLCRSRSGVPICLSVRDTPSRAYQEATERGYRVMAVGAMKATWMDRLVNAEEC